MNSLRVPLPWYAFLFSLPLLFMGVVGSRLITSPTYIHLIMTNHENSKLIDAPQKIHPPDFLGIDKKTPLISALKTFLTAHLSTPSPHVPVFFTPTPPSTFISSSIITTLELYLPTQSKTTYQPSTLTSPSSITQTVPCSSHPCPHPSTTINHLPLSSLFGSR